MNCGDHFSQTVGYFDELENDVYLKLLDEIEDWYTGNYPSGAIVNRVQRFYHTSGRSFCQGIWKEQHARWMSHEYPEWLMELQTTLGNELGCKFTSALINKYITGDDFIPAHSDTTPGIDLPVIASISFGTPRVFRVKSRKDATILDLLLQSGDLLVMSGRSQLDYTHEILKGETRSRRYNITFRQ